MPAVTVLLFARARELAGADAVTLAVAEPSTVGAVRAALREQFPALAPLVAASRVAVNHEFADNTRPVRPGDEVALIPPVSGG